VVEIELDVFSGRPNPSWRLTEPEAQYLGGLLDGLPSGASPPQVDLGYRGFIVRRYDANSRALPELRIFGGTVSDGAQHQADVSGAEAWLIRNACQQDLGQIVDSIPRR
jgi:hypothetical protein